MPAPRDQASRELAVSRPVQIDAKNRDAAAYAAERRRGNSGPFRGKPVELRNGMPETRPYMYGARRHWWAERAIRQAMRDGGDGV